MDRDVFKSRIDLWLMAVIFGSAIFAVGLGIHLSSAEPIRHYIPIGIGLFVLLVSMLVMFPCGYRLGANELHIRCGIYREEIAYREIENIELSSSAISAPALSLQRVRITYRGKSQLVSPVDRQGFVERLQARVNVARRGKKAG